MFRRTRSLVGLNSDKRLLGPRPSRRIIFQPPDMLETVHEIAIYIHRFHNLDLFQQGWYQLKITVRWEDGAGESFGTPARVVQYEAADMASDDTLGVWRIDDTDHSFSTQPFRIKYARQDVLLSVMVSFILSIGKDASPSSSAVILKFELIYAPSLESGYEMQSSFAVASVHEFRIPPKALLGLHSYCPVHFDIFHAVLVDLSLHIVFLKAGTNRDSKKASRASQMMENIAEENDKVSNEILRQGWGSKMIELIKSLLVSREIILEELGRISNGIGQTVDDLNEADLRLGRFEFLGSSIGPGLSSISNHSSGSKMGVGQLAGMLQNILEKSNGSMDCGSDVMLYSLDKEELFDAFLTIGGQLSFLWNSFLKFHRAHKILVLEYLYGIWATDRKAEWSIWMVHSKIEVPHHYLKSEGGDSFHHSDLGKNVVSRKSNDDTSQSAHTRAELHRKNIMQMKINNHSIQDLNIFGDPSHVPIVLVEQEIMNAPISDNPSLDTSCLDNSCATTGEKTVPQMNLHPKRNSHVLRAVVFVHGFQGHHLDLRLVRNQWILIDPGAECLMSETNEDKTAGDFREMGSRLAQEVIAFLKKKIEKLSRYGGCKDIKLSFVGHSIGNVIIRTALTESVMAPFLKHLYTYVSVSGPHLGYWYSSNSLFNSGLWLLKKLKGSQCIHQLTFSDDPDLQNTFFYWLCKQKTLEHFKNIILLSSPQDGYVPYHSARIELCQASSSDQSKKAKIFTEMLNNCLDQICLSSSGRRVFMRCDVNFDTSAQGRNLDTIIGRAAHIEFLETDLYAKFIMWSFPEFFL